MKVILVFLLNLVFVSYSFAGSKPLFVKDGLSERSVLNSISSNLVGSNFKITDYSRAWMAYNPFNLTPLSEGNIWRTISFEFKDQHGKVQSFTCPAILNENNTNFFIYSCENENGGLFKHHKLVKYGYYENSILGEGLVNRSTNGNRAETRGGEEESVQ